MKPPLKIFQPGEECDLGDGQHPGCFWSAPRLYWLQGAVVDLLIAAVVGALCAALVSKASGQCCNGGCCQGGSCQVGPVAPSAPPSAQNVAPLPSRCRIQLADGTAGSGTLVLSDRLVLTCAHLFDESQAGILCIFPDGRRFAATLVEIDKLHDLAAVLLQQPTSITPAVVAGGEPSGELAAGGFGPYGAFAAVHGSIVGHVTATGATYPCAVMTGLVRPGDSGGGVVDCSRRLVGVVWGARDGRTYFTCGRPLCEFLARFQRQQPATQPPTQQPAAGNDCAALQLELNQLKAQLGQVKSCNCNTAAIEQQLAALALRLQLVEAKLSHDTPIRVYLPDGTLAGETKTNLFNGGSIDFTFNPRALLDVPEPAQPR